MALTSFAVTPKAWGKSSPTPLSGSSPISAGAAGLEPAVTVLETVGLPLTDAPKLFYLFMWGMFMTGITELTKLQPILMQLFILCRRIISILANRTL